MRRFSLVVTAVTLLAACSVSDDPEEVGDEADAAALSDAGEAGAGDGQAEQSDVSAVAVEENSDLYSFDYAYPEPAAAIPELREHLDEEMKAARDRLIRSARMGRAEARENGFPYNAFAEGTEWKVVADTPRFLSLSASQYSYTGGAHPNYGSSSLIWDRETDRLLQPLDLFTSPTALTNAIEGRYCEALDAERVKRRGEELDAVDNPFDACPAVKKLTVLLGSSSGKRFDRIGLIADPYVVGPYAEGAYEITLPVTSAVLAAVRPAYRDAFAAR
ncbi:DUF4163 domain-containing protein [Qipengyuania sp. CAU 1752]